MCSSSGTNTTATGTIQNDDTARLSINDVTEAEGDSGTKDFVFSVSLSQPIEEVVEVNVMTVAGTASAGEFSTSTTMLTFDPAMDPNTDGDNDPLTQDVVVHVTGDTTVERDETFRVRLEIATFAGINNSPQILPGKLEGVGTIVNDDTATARIQADATGMESDGFVNFVVELTNVGTPPLEGSDFITVTVNPIPSVPSSAKALDLSFSPHFVTFTANDLDEDMDGDPRTQTVQIPIFADGTIEADETFQLRITNVTFNGINDPSRVQISPTDASKTGTITDNDTAMLSISDAPDQVEGGNAIFRVNLIGDINQPVTVLASTSGPGDLRNPTAEAGLDFVPLVNYPVTFSPNGPKSIDVPVQIINDGMNEGTENFFVDLSMPTFGGATNPRLTISDGTATGRILESSPPATVSFHDLNVSGSEGSGTLNFTVELSRAFQDAVTVDVATAQTLPGTGTDATAGVDFNSIPMTGPVVTFNPGETSKTVKVQINEDGVVEPNEFFLVSLSNPQVDGTTDANRLILGSNVTATGTIENNDTATLSISDPMPQREGDSGQSPMTFTVTLSAAVQGGVTVDFSVNTGTGATAAQLGQDFTQTTFGPITFADGATDPAPQPIQFQILGDLRTELDEVFSVELEPKANFSVQNPQILNSLTVTKATGVGTIRNDDSILVTGPGTTPSGMIHVTDQKRNPVPNLDGKIPYQGFTGAVRVATGDVNGDGTPDVITAQGKGPDGMPTVSVIKVFDGVTGATIRTFTPYDGFTGGVFVAAADLNQDGFADIVTGPDVSGGPQVKAFDGNSGATIFDFWAYPVTFFGGVRVATGDVTGDGIPDIITGAGPGGGPHVRVFDGSVPQNSSAAGVDIHDKGLGAIGSFYAYADSFTGGVFVAAGDFGGGSNRADVIVGKDSSVGGGSWVRIFDAGNLKFEQINAFPGFDGGVRVGTVELNGVGKPDLVLAAGPGGGPHVRVFDGDSINVDRFSVENIGAKEDGLVVQAPLPQPLLTSPQSGSDGFYAYDPTFSGGVYVSGTVFPPTAGSPLRLAAGTVLPDGPVATITTADLAPVVSAAISRLENAGLDPAAAQALADTHFVVQDLAPGLLGLASDGVVYLDDNAAGVGWFIDPTPSSDEEFSNQTPNGLLGASPGVDLLSVVLHELGHTLGLGDLPADQVPGSMMTGTLAPGIRRLPDDQTLDDVFAGDTLWNGLLLNG